MAKLTATEIVAIIRAGHESQVAMLELGGIKITYKGAEQAQVSQPIYNFDTQPTENNPQQQVKSESSPYSELDDLLLNVTNPVEFERRQLLGDAFNEET